MIESRFQEFRVVYGFGFRASEKKTLELWAKEAQGLIRTSCSHGTTMAPPIHVCVYVYLYIYICVLCMCV